MGNMLSAVLRKISVHEHQMTVAGIADLVVVDPQGPEKPVALLSHDQVLRSYDKAILSERS